MTKRKTKRVEVNAAEKEEAPRKQTYEYAFVKELTARQNRRICIIEEFNATGRDSPIEGKFYSKSNEMNGKAFAERREHWKCRLDICKGSRRTEEFPVLESQTYGWMPSSLSRTVLGRINCIQAPKQRCEMTAYDENLVSERVTQRPKFTGVRFNVN